MQNRVAVLAVSVFSLHAQTFLPVNLAGYDKMLVRGFPLGSSAPALPEIDISVHIGAVRFSDNGRSMYGMLRTGELVRIDFQPVRTVSLLAAGRLNVSSFSVTNDGGKILIDGRENSKNRSRCGVFEYTLNTNVIRHVLVEPCQGFAPSLTLRASPDGTRILRRSSSGLDLIDLGSGTTKPLGDLSWAEWSPDGKWIAAIQWESLRLFLIDANDTSKKREFAEISGVAWSPDSKSILVRRTHLLRCGFSIDTDSPGSLEIVDIATGKRTFIHSSLCRIGEGAIGWLDRTLLPR